MPWSWPSLRLCLDSFCDDPPDDEHRYDLYTADRKTAIAVTEADVESDYLVGGVLGKGGFGLVKEGLHRKTQVKAALKYVDRKGISRRDERLVLMEAGILHGLAHGHVIELFGFYKWDGAYCLALEHMAGGELCDDITRRIFYSEACARRVILQVLDALAFLHRRGIVHRDVKPENLLLPKAGGDHVKLADFGFATVLTPPTYKVVEPVGSPGYAAPELLRLLPYDGQADVFSLGVIAFVLLSGYLPFYGSDVPDVVKATLQGEPSYDEVQWSATTEGARSFVKSLLNPCPNERPTAEAALFHPWMKTSGRILLKRSLSDRRSGSSKSLLEDFQAQRKKKFRTVVGVVLAANRLQKTLNSEKLAEGTENGEVPTKRSLEATGTIREEEGTRGPGLVAGAY